MKVANITSQMQIDLKVLTEIKITHVLGGRKAKANINLLLKMRITVQFLHDFYGYFEIIDYSEIPFMRFEEAKDYIKKWYVDFNSRLMINKINEEGKKC